MATVTQVNITDPDITESNDPGFAGPNWTSKLHEGLVLQGQSHLVAEYNITAANNKYLSPNGKNGNGIDVWYQTNLANSAWRPYYNWSITNNYFTATGKTGYIESCNLKVFYTPPVNVSGLDPDPTSNEGGFAAHLHEIRFTYTELDFVATDPVLVSVSISKQTVSPSSTNIITLNANSTGTVGLSVRKLNAGKTDYTHSYNFSNSTWVAKASGLQSKTVNITEEEVENNSYCSVVMPSTDESATYSVVMTAGTLALGSGVPDAINELNFETVQNVRATFNPGTKTNVTSSGGITTGYNPEVSFADVTMPFTFTYTKSSGTMTLNRQPLESDVTGHYQFVTVGSTVAQGSSTIPTDDTEGVKAGMYLKDGNFELGTQRTSRIPENTLVNSISNNTNFTMKNAIGSAVAAQAAITVDGSLSEKILLTSDWLYEFENFEAVLNAEATAVTVTGNLIIKKWGRSTPDGNIKLQPNFITIS